MPRLEFTLTIATNSNVMADRLDVAAALDDVAEQLRSINATQTINGPVRDRAGAMIGTYVLHVKEGR